MSESSERLEDEYAEIQSCFKDHPQISVVSTEGSPVNQYVIEYRVNGLVQLDDGEVVQSDQHRVELRLSFGFPHFPPNCRPLTKIFHPDIDPSAIKIANYWNESTRLSELILQIGRMICWQVYSVKDGFNQTAIDWLNENKDSVPMDMIQQGDDPVSGEELPGIDIDFLPETPYEAVSVSDLETLSENISETSLADDSGTIEFELSDANDEPFELSSADATPTEEEDGVADEIDFNFNPLVSSDEVELSFTDSPVEPEDAPLELHLENEDITPVEKENFNFVAAGADSADIILEDVVLDEDDSTPSFPESSEEDIDVDLAAVDVDYDILNGMVAQHNYFAAQKKLASLAPENKSTASSALQLLVEQRVEEATAVYWEAKNLEREGLLEDAAHKFESVLDLVNDYPDLEVDIARVRDARAEASATTLSASNLCLENSDFEPAQIKDMMLTETVVSPPGGPDQSSAVPPKKKRPKTSKVTKKKGEPPVKRKQNKSLIFAVAGLLIVLVSAGWFFVEWRSFSQAEHKWDEITGLLEKNEYEQAKEECREIRVLLSRVKIIMGTGKKEILGRVDDLLKSEHFLEGLEGKTLYQGNYISKRAHRAYVDIQDLVAEAERRGALSKWQESAELYGKAFAIAQANKERLDVKFYDELLVDFNKATFTNLVSLGKKAFINRQWPQAIEKFEAALKVYQGDGVTAPARTADVNRDLQRARFSQYVIEGDNALKLNDFSTSAENFAKAYELAQDHNLITAENRQKVLVKLKQSSLIKIMDDAEQYVAQKRWAEAVKLYTQVKKYTMDGYPLVGMSVAESRKRVEGLLVSTKIDMERGIIAKKQEAQQYTAVEEAYDRILLTIDESSVKNQPSFKKLRRKIEEDREKVHLRAMVDKHLMYLRGNYRSIVAENFTGVRVKALSKPKVVFLGQKERTLIFKIQCREQRESKYYTLELIYQYDLELEQWGLPER